MLTTILQADNKSNKKNPKSKSNLHRLPHRTQNVSQSQFTAECLPSVHGQLWPQSDCPNGQRIKQSWGTFLFFLMDVWLKTFKTLKATTSKVTWNPKKTNVPSCESGNGIQVCLHLYLLRLNRDHRQPFSDLSGPKKSQFTSTLSSPVGERQRHDSRMSDF